MRIIPVIDLAGGRVVRGVAGKRAEYRPVESVLTASCRPLEVAQAFRERFGLDEIYLADLDAIEHDRPAASTYEALAADGFRLLIDAGVRTADRIATVLDAGADAVLGSETVPGAEALRELTAGADAARLVFSVDLVAGQPRLGGAWPDESPAGIVRAVHAVGVRRLIVLDLSRVGVGAGLGTEALCTALRERFADLKIIAGGGVRNRADLEALAEVGIDAVLVASALHDGRIGIDDIRRWGADAG